MLPRIHNCFCRFPFEFVAYGQVSPEGPTVSGHQGRTDEWSLHPRLLWLEHQERLNYNQVLVDVWGDSTASASADEKFCFNGNSANDEDRLRAWGNAWETVQPRIVDRAP